MNKRTLLSSALVCLLLASMGVVAQRCARRPAKGTICGDPTAACKTSYEFPPYDLPFRISEHTVIWESEPFYAVILNSFKAAADSDCEKFVPEDERAAAQALFPHNKVFTSRCNEPASPYYVGAQPGTRFMAVYAGRTRAEAAKFLAQVVATGKFPGANLRRISIGFNGT
jgi:hypothetical protein